ncbi:MAG: hypothetical protein FJ096_19545 [Deltaproteobacteria bacterium]|nr:hypothetical protein [Deltaproteobacteria bacterium]
MVERPPRPLRTATLAALVVGAFASLLVALSLYPEARYALTPRDPVELGSFAKAELGGAVEGRYVRAEVQLAGQPGLGFHRIGEGERRLVRTAPSEPRRDTAPRFVEHAVPAGAGARFLPPRIVAGRLSRVGELGLRHRGLARPLEGLVPEASSRGWVIVDGEAPRSAAWVMGVEAMVFGFFVWNVVSLARILKRRPAA